MYYPTDVEIIGIMADTHVDMLEGEANATPHVIREFLERGVKLILHGGDMAARDLDSKLYGGLPVVCALVKDQVGELEFQFPPPGWMFTKPGDRIVRLDRHKKIYVGHNTSHDFLTGSESAMAQKINAVRNEHDGVVLYVTAHTHHQFAIVTRTITLINPGAVWNGFNGHEFCTFNIKNGEIVCSRVPQTKSGRDPFSVGIISDSFNVSELDPHFWEKLRAAFVKRGVRYIIHCGNIALGDIGRRELGDFEVHYYLRKDQDDFLKRTKSAVKYPDNWHQVMVDNPVVNIEGHIFCIQLELGAELAEKSEFAMEELCLGLRKKYPGTRTVLCGLTGHPFYEEGQELCLINPGSALDRKWAVLCLPDTMTLTLNGSIPPDPLSK